MTTHAGQLTLQRYLAEEPVDPAVAAHVTSCADCQAKLAALRAEQQQFEAAIPFERFAAGVEKSARLQQRPVSSRWRPVLFAAAACLVALVAGRLVLSGEEPTSRIKGGGTVDFVVAGPRGQRAAAEPEQLEVGDRVRIGVSGHRHVLALSIDDAGEVSTIYAEALPGEAQTWLPDSIEFTGKGREHVVVLLGDAPIDAGLAQQRLEDAWKAADGDVRKLGTIEVPGVQVHRTFLKP